MTTFFPHVFGHNKIQQYLAAAIDNKRIANTILFYGEEGLGKSTAALDLASRITGTTRIWDEQIASHWLTVEGDNIESLYRSPDGKIFYMKPQHMELKMEQFRLLLENIIILDDTPHVCIIDEAQSMGAAIANAWLKTLEEPKGNLFFILVSHDITRMLPTVISRAELYEFTSLDYQSFELFLNKQKKRLPDLQGRNYKDIYRISTGNPAIAIELFGENGMQCYDKAVRFWETITHSSLPYTQIFESNKKIDKKEFQQELLWCMSIGRNIMLLANISEQAETITYITERERAIAQIWSDGKAEKALEILKVAYNACQRYISTKNILDMIVINLCLIKNGG